MSTSTVSRKGLTTVPSKIREALGIKSGDKLEWRVVKKNDKTLIEVEAEKNPYEFLKGRRKDPEGTYNRVENLADALIAKEARAGAGHRT
ncbi:MAG: AbrB/MazE/SpoVT family DNA-binding domain-containing protein [Candidatus Hydrothermarchaeales archaeon]